MLADIDIFIEFFILEKKKTKMCSVDSCRSSIFKKAQEKQPEKFDCPVNQIKKCKKRQDSLECVVSTSKAKYILKDMLVTEHILKGMLVTERCIRLHKR